MIPEAESAKYYHCNPDVVLREETEEGGLLYNPDTNQVKVMNSTGLFIWKQFEKSNDIDAVAAALLEQFEETPIDEVKGDVKEFLENLVETGFIGEITS